MGPAEARAIRGSRKLTQQEPNDKKKVECPLYSSSLHWEPRACTRRELVKEFESGKNLEKEVEDLVPKAGFEPAHP